MNRISKLAVPIFLGSILSIGILLGARAAGGMPHAQADSGPPPKFYGIVALNPAACSGINNGLEFEGTASVSLNGGSVFSNGCLGAAGTTLDIDLDGGVFEYVVELYIAGNPTIDPPPVQVTQTLDLEVDDFIAARCATLSNQTFGGGTIDPGNYGASTWTSGALMMNPGLYCFTGDFNINGGSVVGSGVTIYMISGDLEVSSYAIVQFNAPVAEDDPGPGVAGLLAASAPGNTGVLSLRGKMGSVYTGTVYAPAGNIEIGGPASLTQVYATRLIGNNVLLHTAIDLVIDFPRLFRLDLAKTAPAAVTAGDPLTYTLTVSNAHNFAAVENVVLTDTLPAGTAFVSASEPYTLTGDTITWTLPWLGHKETWEVELVVEVPADWAEAELVNADYGVTGDDAVVTIGDPVVTTVEPLPTATPTPDLPPMWIADIDMSLLHPPPRGFQAEAVITIVDSNGPVVWAGVNGLFDGDTVAYVGGVTDNSGQVTLLSPPIFGSWSGWIFCVELVSEPAHWYDEAQNVEVCDSIFNGIPTPTLTAGPSAMFTPTATPTSTDTPSPSPTVTSTATNTPGGRPTKTPTPALPTATATMSPTPGGNQVHVADLDGTGAPNGDLRWNATVEITVVDQDGLPVSGATVSGAWTNGATSSGSCQTNVSGKCSITRLLIRNQVVSVTFTVTNVSAEGHAYDPWANADPDGDSNGTVIFVNKP